MTEPTANIPMRTLYSGAKMPGIGLGTFGSDHVDAATVANTVRLGLALGYRHIDCASVYGNEAEIGAVLGSTAIPRDELWISSKVWNDSHHAVGESCEQTLRDLGIDYLDNFLVHWPFPNSHAAHANVDERNPRAVAFNPDAYLEAWAQMESLVERGLVRHIGTSNMTPAKFDAVFADMTITPSVNQMELHPHFQQSAFRSYLRERSIQPIGFCPLGSPNRPERDRTPNDTSPIDDRGIRALAEARGVHPAAVCLMWAIDQGHTPIPFSTTEHNLAANLAAATADPLTADEQAMLVAADRDCRMIKGQVFLWKDGQSWTDLWDIDGIIAT